MARRERIDLEITLERLHLLPQEKTDESHHLITVHLLWPRVLIPRRSSTLPLDLKNGGWGEDGTASWCRRILFKETLEGSFGISCSVSSAIQNTAWRKAVRTIAAGAIHIGADMLEDAVPAGGKFAALPVDYLAGQLKQMPETPVLGMAEQDLSTELLADREELLLTLPLLAEHAITKMVPKGPPRDRRYTRQTLYPREAEVGSLVLKLKAL